MPSTTIHRAADPATGHVAARRSSRVSGLVGLCAVVLGLLSALLTFLVLANMTPLVPTHELNLVLFGLNGACVLVLVGVVAWETASLIRARRRGLAAAGLHARIVALLALVASAPAILVAVMGWMTLERGLDFQFGRYIGNLLATSVEVAKAYREQQCRTIWREITLMAGDLNRAGPTFAANRAFFHDFMQSRALFLGFPVAMVMKGDGSVIERIDLRPLDHLPSPTEADISAAKAAEPGCIAASAGNVFGAMIVLSGFPDSHFLYVARPVDPQALEFPRTAAQAVAFYEDLEAKKVGVQVAFASMYVLVALILLLSAIWLGLAFANRLVAPIRRLIHATDQVAIGNYYVQVPVRRGEGDLGHLGETFNKMTSELRRSHDELVAASSLIDRRRLFTEAVLSGVSAAVLGIDGAGMITALNPSAERLFGARRDDWLGRPVGEVFPELRDLLGAAREERGRHLQGQIVQGHGVQGQVVVNRKERDRTLMVRVTGEAAGGTEAGVVVTLDDITDLIHAQRTAAWADVARRIAHEIKNPLTPIQLSAERIRRKYGKVITTDREIFDQCTNTIVRQVDDIKRMVDEFSSFAQMPKPTPETDDISEIVREVLFLMRVGHPDVTISEDMPKGPLRARFDRRLVSQAVTNIVKNAAEGIAALDPDARGEGRIDVRLAEIDGNVTIEVMDNGKGFPAENRQRLLEPYMTTRDGGTGLGLAIVGKILEDHGGGIDLADRPGGGRGALVRLWFPLNGGPETRPPATAARRSRPVPAA